ncbi:MAG: hypothetical protein D3908_15735 [Candidatus Electrothrix sp. AUS4]|nr:hypothetical protein [Candidatus Electrothrix sp. AUS4]
MNKRSWRLVHRWAGLFLLGFVLFYCLTGLLLNHRKSFDYFQSRQETVVTIEVQPQNVLNEVVEKYKQLIGRDDDPTVIRLKPEGIIEFLYGSHGRITYIIDTVQGRMIRLDKEEQQPWSWLNNLHKSSKVSLTWLGLADCIAVLIIVLALSGLVIFRYTRWDILLLACGGLVMLGGMLLS